MRFEHSAHFKGRLNWNALRLSSLVENPASKEADKNETHVPLRQGSMKMINDAASRVGEGGADAQSLDKRMDKLEAAVQDLTSLVAKMSDKLDNVVRIEYCAL